MPTIGIFPASGGLGTSTYTYLLKVVPHNNVILVNRYPEKVSESYVQSGVRVRQASYESSKDELKDAFKDIDILFLISYPSHNKEYRIKVQTQALHAAQGAGVSHVFYSSLAYAGVQNSASLAGVMQAHLACESELEDLSHYAEKYDKPFTYTIIREGLYSESYPIYTAFFNVAEPADEILIPHDGSGPGITWVKRDELGEATANLIASYYADTKGFPYINATLTLTGPREWSLDETVRVLGEVAGREVKIRQISVDEYVRLPQVLERFGTEEAARTWATAWDAIRAGETALVTPMLEGILGRKPEEFDVTMGKLPKQG